MFNLFFNIGTERNLIDLRGTQNEYFIFPSITGQGDLCSIQCLILSAQLLICHDFCSKHFAGDTQFFKSKAFISINRTG